MAFVVDTNVVSELMRDIPDPNVYRWFNDRDESELFLTAVVEAELRFGISVLPHGRRRNELETTLEQTIAIDFNGRVMPFDGEAARAYATIGAHRRSIGKPIKVMDCQIAAIAKSKGVVVATRDVSDFEHCGVQIVNPWEYST